MAVVGATLGTVVFASHCWKPLARRLQLLSTLVPGFFALRANKPVRVYGKAWLPKRSSHLGRKFSFQMIYL